MNDVVDVTDDEVVLQSTSEAHGIEFSSTNYAAVNGFIIKYVIIKL